jgi:hypothetical protein
MTSRFAGVRAYLIFAALLAVATTCAADAPSRAASDGFEQYVSRVESQSAQEHGSAQFFLRAIGSDRAARLRHGDVIVERLTPAGGESLPGALLHDWRGTAFVPGATAVEFEAMLRNFDAYPAEFSPQVLQAKLIAGHGDQFQMEMRVRQKHVIAITLDGFYQVRFGRLDADHGWSTSQSVRMEEIGAGGRPLSPHAEHGFLWRLDTWWTWEQKDGGLYVRIESVSLTRSIPAGLGWLVGPFVENIPRDSLAFTLRAACAAVRNSAGRGGKGERQ